MRLYMRQPKGGERGKSRCRLKGQIASIINLMRFNFPIHKAVYFPLFHSHRDSTIDIKKILSLFIYLLSSLLNFCYCAFFQHSACAFLFHNDGPNFISSPSNARYALYSHPFDSFLLYILRNNCHEVYFVNTSQA